MDKNKVAGINIEDSQEKQKIYERYLQAFKKGVYSYIKEEMVIDPQTKKQRIFPRKYFSGGGDFKHISTENIFSRVEYVPVQSIIKADQAMLVQTIIQTLNTGLEFVGIGPDVNAFHWSVITAVAFGYHGYSLMQRSSFSNKWKKTSLALVVLSAVVGAIIPALPRIDGFHFDRSIKNFLNTNNKLIANDNSKNKFQPSSSHQLLLM